MLDGIPERMRGGLARYLILGIRPGSFLCAVLMNDFVMACCHADDENLGLLRAYSKFLTLDAPVKSFGSCAAFNAWLGVDHSALFPADDPLRRYL